MSKPELSACLEWLFAEPDDDFVDRIGKAADAGFEAFEFWLWSNKNIDAIERASKKHGIAVACCVAEPLITLTDPANHETWLASLRQTAEVAKRLNAPVLIAQAGNSVARIDRSAQRDALIGALHQAADVLAGTGIRLGVEPLNTLIDHPGYFLDSTAEAFEIVDGVGRPEIGIVYDLYHAAVMEEPFEETLTGHIDQIIHVHVADHPGRHQPGSGIIDLLPRLNFLLENGYDGRIGFEFKPKAMDTEDLAGMRASFAKDLAGH